jgi:hypothetical protein
VPDQKQSGASPQASQGGSDKPEKPGQPQEPQEPQAPPSGVPEGQYSRDRLIEESHRILGYPPDVVAGALHGQEQDTYSIEQARELVEANESRVITPEGE